MIANTSPHFQKSVESGRVDKSSPIPYYIQLKDAIRENLETGKWKPGEQIPGEPQLCELYGISRTVVRQALKELTYEGLLVRAKGRGTFVAEPKIIENLIQSLTGFYQDMVDRGHSTTSQVLRQQIVPANAIIAGHLDLEPGTEVIEITRLRFVQEEPIVLVNSYLPYAACPALLHADLSGKSMYEFMEKQCGLFMARGRRTIEAVPANEYEAGLLQVERGAPLIMLNSVSYLEDGSPIEYYHAVHRGDRSRFEVELLRRKEYGK